MPAISAGEAAQRFFDDARAAFGRTAVVTRALRVGGRPLRLRFGSRALAERLGPAFAHLPEGNDDDHAAPDFTVDAWDSASSGIPTPVPPWGRANYGPHGEIRPTGDAWPRPLRARFNVHAGILGMVDAARRAAIWWTRDAALVPDYERGAPFALLLHWWHLLCPPAPGEGAPPACAVHAAAVGTARDGGLLLVGRGGSGKSTTALAALAAGFDYAGDDYCLLQPGAAAASGPVAASLFATGKMSDAMLARFSEFAPAVVNPDREPGEKALLFLAREGEFAARLVPALPLRAILLPEVFPGRAETRLVPVGPAAALQALAPSTVFLFPRAPDEGAALLAQLAGVTRRLPAFHLQLGADADVRRTPELLRNLLTRLP